MDENSLRDVPTHMLQSKLGFVGFDSPGAQYGVLGKVIGSLDKASKWIDSYIPPIFRSSRSLRNSQNKTIIGDHKLPRNFDAREKWPGCVGAVRD